MAVKTKPAPKSNIEWIGKTDGNKIRFGVVEGYDKAGALKFSKRMVIRNYSLSRLKYPSIVIKILKEWDK